MLWYDYFFEEPMLPLIIPIFIGILIAIIIKSLWLIVFPSLLTILVTVLTYNFKKERVAYLNNHNGLLYAFMYDKVLIIRLRNTDLELEYDSMKRKKSLLGLWRMKSGNFFVLTLPKRIEKENELFFKKLYEKIK